MKITMLSRETWLVKAERVGLHPMRCVKFTHNVSGRNAFRYMKNHLIIFVESKRMCAELDGEILTLNAGDALWVPPGIIRRTHIDLKDMPEKDYRLHFNFGNAGTEYRFSGRGLHLRKAWGLLPFFQTINRACRNLRKYDAYTARGACLALASTFISMLEESGKRELPEDIFAKMSAFIEENATRKINPSELAAIAGLSPDYFSRKFKKDCGVSPKEFIKREKIHCIASFMMESNLSVKETAAYFGYDDPSFFCRQFREVMGCSPLSHSRH